MAKEKVVARQQYDYDTEGKYGIDFTGCVSLTQQQFKEECDINNIIKKHVQQGVNPFFIEQAQELYQDVSEIGDYQDCYEKVVKAQELFDNMDAHIRDRFDGDPGKFVAFCSDKANLKELREMGLANKEEIVVTPTVVEATKEVVK